MPCRSSDPLKKRVFSIESSLLDRNVDFHGPNYSTFHQYAQERSAMTMSSCISFICATVEHHSPFLFRRKWSQWKNLIFLATTVAIIWAMFIVFSQGCFRSKSSGGDSFEQLNLEHWDYNHYTLESDSLPPIKGVTDTERLLLIVQFATDASSGATSANLGWLPISSRPNRAYARQWSFDFFMTFDSENYCQAQLLLDMYQLQRSTWTSSSSIAWGEETKQLYDAVLILSPDSIITDMDYDILNFLPEDKLVTITDNGEKLKMINLRHPMFPTLAKMWLASCEEPLEDVVESLSSDYHVLHPSLAGFIEPRLVRFSDHPTTLQTTADSVCYRYYPRCDVV